MRIYLAGALFNVAERVHLLNLEKYLKKLGYEIILPQREALKYFDGETFDTKKIVGDCRKAAASSESIMVACIDGADADSGTCIECGVAIGLKRPFITYRTDFRTDTEREIGVNAMLTGKGIFSIYFPCYLANMV